MGMIRFSCRACQRVLRVGEQYAGRQSKCPGCSSPLKVPLVSEVDLGSATGATLPGDPSAFDEDAGAAAPTNDAAAAPWQGAATVDGENVLEGHPESWRTAAGGLRIVWWGSVLQMLVLVAVSLGIAALTVLRLRAISELFRDVFTDGRSDRPALIDAPTLVLLLLLASLIMTVIGLIGVLLRIIGCIGLLAIPVGRLVAVMVVLCELAPIACGIAVIYSICRMLAEGESRYVESLAYNIVLVYLGSCGSAVIALLGLVFMLLLLARLGSALGSKELGPRIINFVGWFIGGIVAIGVVILARALFQVFLAPDGPSIGADLVVAFTALVNLAIPLIIWGKYLGMLTAARMLIRRRVGAR